MENINSKIDYIKFFAELAETYSQEWSKVKTDNYVFANQESLEHVDLKELKRFILKSHKFVPKPDEFAQALKIVGPNKEHLAKLDVDWVLTKCEDHGEGFYDFVSEYLGYVKDSIMGFVVAQDQSVKDKQIKDDYWSWVFAVQKYRQDFGQGNVMQFPKVMPREVFARKVISFKTANRSKNQTP